MGAHLFEDEDRVQLRCLLTAHAGCLAADSFLAQQACSPSGVGDASSVSPLLRAMYHLLQPRTCLTVLPVS